MNKFLERLNAGDVLVADGATGTNLQIMGLKAGTPPEDLVMDNPDILLMLANRFVEAGSDIILTCTFGGTRLRMKDSKYVDRAPEVNMRAVDLARKAASKRNGVLVAGSLGPTGALMVPYGPLTPDDARATYAEQAKALTEGGVDLLLIETMFALEEATAAFEGARSASDLPIVVSFSYDRGVRTMMGVKTSQVMKTYTDLGAVAIGANCGEGLEMIPEVLRQMREAAPEAVLIAKPNAGLPRLVGGQTVYDVTPQQFALTMDDFVTRGAQVIGSCCGSSPEYIRALAAR